MPGLLCVRALVASPARPGEGVISVTSSGHQVPTEGDLLQRRSAYGDRLRKGPLRPRPTPTPSRVTSPWSTPKGTTRRTQSIAFSTPKKRRKANTHPHRGIAKQPLGVDPRVVSRPQPEPLAHQTVRPRNIPHQLRPPRRGSRVG